MDRIEVRRTGKTWGLFLNGRLEEGGFFDREEARKAAEALILSLGLPVLRRG